MIEQSHSFLQFWIQTLQSLGKQLKHPQKNACIVMALYSVGGHPLRWIYISQPRKDEKLTGSK